jgi:nitroimidazol reductase NimA-like FMN-containing flavoprotein (pyridoxamine 5'-phosphate oxidase superfamily)
MRRKDREITDYNQMIEIVKGCDCCRIGLLDSDWAYIVPLNFGFESNEGKLTLFFHGAAEGKKIDLIREHRTASFEMDRKHKLVAGENACAFSFLYQSVIGKGAIQLIKKYEDKVYGLQKIMSHYTANQLWDFDREHVNRVSVIKLEVMEWSCKEH